MYIPIVPRLRRSATLRPDVQIGTDVDLGSGRHTPVFGRDGQDVYADCFDTNHGARWKKGADAGDALVINKKVFDYQLSDYVEIGRSNGDEPNQLQYKGQLSARGVSPVQLEPFYDLANYGPAAFAGMRPTRPRFSGMEALQGLQSLSVPLHEKVKEFKHNVHSLKGIGNNYLALQFDYGNLISDVIGFVKETHDIGKQIKQLIRDNGQLVKRRIELAADSNTTTSSEHNYSAFNQTFVSQAYVDVPLIEETLLYEKRIWASASFRYHLPDLPQFPLVADLGATLYGIKANFSNIWKVIPWSWLVDWYANVGPVLSNMQDTLDFRLVAERFYLMGEQKLTQTRKASGTFVQLNTKNPISVAASAVTTYHVKQRLPGNPFGLGSNPEPLDNFQLAIMGSLGLSKLPG